MSGTNPLYSAIATIVRVVITRQYLLATREIRQETARAADASRQMIEEVQRQRLETLRPIVTATFVGGVDVHTQYSNYPRLLEATLRRDTKPSIMLHNAGPGPALGVGMRVMIRLSKDSSRGWFGHVLVRGAVIRPDVYWPLFDVLSPDPLLQGDVEHVVRCTACRPLDTTSARGVVLVHGTCRGRPDRPREHPGGDR